MGLCESRTARKRWDPPDQAGQNIFADRLANLERRDSNLEEQKRKMTTHKEAVKWQTRIASKGHRVEWTRDLKASKQDRGEPIANICTQIRKRSPGEMVYLQGPSPLNSWTVDPNVQKIKQRQKEACIDEQGTPDRTQAEKGSTQEMEIESGDLEGIWRHSPTVQGWC